MRKNGRRDSYAPKEPFVCTHCQYGKCDECSDILRVIANLSEICMCQSPSHTGEPALVQVRDPFTSDVHAPGMIIKEDGEIVKEVKPYE